MKRLIRRIVYAVPGTQARWVAFNKALGREGHIEFSGWGMTTESTPPWLNGGDALACDFARVHTDVVDRVRAGTMKLSQLNDVQDTALRLQELMWRHYVVFWSASYAATATALPSTTLVECGVCDGLTAYFAMRAAQRAGAYRAFLYDAWEGMKTEYLLTSEQHAAGSYSYLSIENTQRNLAPFNGQTTFVKGFIPESFATCDIPAQVGWLHIDLNSALPTKAALEVLFDRIAVGGVILFDDYGWGGYADTKHAVNRFLSGRPGVLLPLPTGQAMFFKHKP